LGGKEQLHSDVILLICLAFVTGITPAENGILIPSFSVFP
jgi:hypothetical protein